MFELRVLIKIFDFGFNLAIWIFRDELFDMPMPSSSAEHRSHLHLRLGGAPIPGSLGAPISPASAVDFPMREEELETEEVSGLNEH